MKKTYYYATFLIITTWFIASTLISNSIVLPSPFEVINSMFNIIFDIKTVQIIIVTLLRLFLALIISFLLSLILAIISFRYIWFEEFFNIFYIILKTVPNVAVMLISLIWLGREGAVYLIVLLVTFPILYSSILYSFKHIDDTLLDDLLMNEGDYFLKMIYAYLPLIKKPTILAIKNCLSLGFKVTVMAELLSQVNIGIGKELYLYKINLEMSDIFAWTIIMILVSFIFDMIIDNIIKY